LLRIRLSRVGKRKQPSYRLVVADSRAPRDGAFIKIIGHYNPRTQPATLVVKEEEAVEWLRRGAQPSETAAKLLTRIGVMERAGRAPAVWDRKTPVKPKKVKEEAAAAEAPTEAEAPPEQQPEPQPAEAAAAEAPAEAKAAPEEHPEAEEAEAEATAAEAPAEAEAAATEQQPEPAEGTQAKTRKKAKAPATEEQPEPETAEAAAEAEGETPKNAETTE
jgi:small subunit ribosomal protein S16